MSDTYRRLALSVANGDLAARDPLLDFLHERGKDMEAMYLSELKPLTRYERPPIPDDLGYTRFYCEAAERLTDLTALQRSDATADRLVDWFFKSGAVYVGTTANVQEPLPMYPWAATYIAHDIHRHGNTRWIYGRVNRAWNSERIVQYLAGMDSFSEIHRFLVPRLDAWKVQVVLECWQQVRTMPGNNEKLPLTTRVNRRYWDRRIAAEQHARDDAIMAASLALL